jgi:hypothetical protein
MTERRDFLALLAGFASLTDSGAALAANSQLSSSGKTSDSMQPPLFVQRGMPGPFHAVLKSLQGEWSVSKEIYIAIGSPGAPAKSAGMMAQRHWFGGGRHLLDTTAGAIGGSPYYRLGVLGFSNPDGCYEWVTFDAINSNQMLYRGPRLSKPSMHLSMTGIFTDQGLLGEELAGKQIPMRTLIDIQDNDRHLIELYFTPPGRGEVLIDRSVYTRL